jgi:peptidoglycan hydrolase-like protein with peptidoglycan-binding domain
VVVPFNAGQHPRAAGGLFAATAASKTNHPTGAWAAGPIRKVTGRKGTRDARVVALQRQLNALGITDERGRPLLVDGIPGNHTTAAIKKWQKAHGVPQSGEVDAKTMVAILSDKPAPKKPTARSRMTAKPKPRPSSSKKPAPKPKPAPPAYADRGRGYSRIGGGAST